MFRQVLISLAIAVGSVTHTFASDPAACLQKDAIYQDEDQNYSLRFYTLKEGLGISSNTFMILPQGTELRLNGWVIWQGEPQRPEAILNHNCPEGDVTGEELQACRVWQGVIYSLWENGQSDLLPLPEDQAAKVLLLPDLGRSMRASPAWEKLGMEKLPWDAFRLSGCQKSSVNKEGE